MANETTLIKGPAPAEAKEVSARVVDGKEKNDLIESRDLELSAVGKGLNTASGALSNSVDVGSRVVGKALASATGSLKKTESKTIKDVLKALLGAGLGLSFFKEMLGIPKALSDPETQEKQSPLLIKGTKWVVGGSLALGLLKGVMTGTGLSMPLLMFGLLTFAGTHALSSSYENPNSIFGKVTSGLGLRDKLIEALDTLKFSKFLS
ncbi:MAG: hypothetical protein OXU45_00410 [Candidatus Melainabacteria bacterium]|nr:hypothetical protein [Candidatus Melainabacteria bacterium]